jgi:hypothetical protein
MAQVDLICLANSRKLGGRCIAGLRLDGSGWVRPVGEAPDGTLYPADFMLRDGTESKLLSRWTKSCVRAVVRALPFSVFSPYSSSLLAGRLWPNCLDVIRVGVQAARPNPQQPENWVIDGARWTLKARPVSGSFGQVLKDAIVPGPELLLGREELVALSSFGRRQASSSLALITPESIHLYRHINTRGKRQVRCRFQIGSRKDMQAYDLSVTDPRWERAVHEQGDRTIGQTDGRFLLTISLGEPYGSNCYKLVAAVILLPELIAKTL